jgi:hypothetical protein
MLRLGYTAAKNTPVDISPAERRQGTYVIGTTGTGKSTLLKNIVYQDMRYREAGIKHGLCVLDPHGDTIDELLELVPKDRVDDVILFDPMDYDRPFGLNLLQCDTKDPHEVRWVVSTIMGTLSRLFSYSWGPRLEHVLRSVLLTALTFERATFLEVIDLLSITFEEQKELAKILNDRFLKQFWDTFPKSSRERYELTASTLNKISPFVTDLSMRHIIGQAENTFDMQNIMDEGKILFVNLSKGDLGEANSSLLGAVLVNLVLIAALKRRSIHPKKRRQFHLIVDEFQNFANESFDILQSEARKYAVDVTVAHQYRDQLTLSSKGSTFNVGNLVVFRVTGRDSYDLASQFDNTPPPPDTRVEPIYQEFDYQGLNTLIQAQLNTGEGTLYQEVELPRRPYSDVESEKANKLSILPNYEAWCRLIQYPEFGNRPKLIERHIVTEELGKGEHDPEIAAQIRKQSSEMGTPREEVEKEFEQRHLKILEDDEDYPTAKALDNKGSE